MSTFAENLKWLQIAVDKSLKGIESLTSGVVYCKAVHMRDQSLLKIESIRDPAKT